MDTNGWDDRDSGSQKTFCIDPRKVNIARGVAAEAFVKREVIIAHVSINNGRIVCDEPSYIPSRNSIAPFCGSLICIPIISEENNDRCLGVLCFDSYDRAAFNAPIIRDILLLLARHAALVLSINEKCLKDVFPVETAK